MDVATFFYMVSALAAANAIRLAYKQRQDAKAEAAYELHKASQVKPVAHNVERAGEKRAAELEWRL
jgi:hypothetical protein